MTAAADDPLADLRAVEAWTRAWELAHGPPLRSITLHPDDLEVLVRVLEQGRKPTSTIPTINDVPVYVDDRVPRGRPWFDPPEAVRRINDGGST